MVLAQSNGRSSRDPLFRWTGTTEWEVYQSETSLDGVETSFNSFREKYSVDLSGAIWNPQFNRLSLGMDLFKTSGSTEVTDHDSKSFGYRAQTTFFPSRPFPLSLYARSTVTDVTGSALVRDDRQTKSWGALWSFLTRPKQKIRFSYDRTAYDLTSPLLLKERSSTGTVNYDQSFERSELSAQYNRHQDRELTQQSRFTRTNLILNESTRFKNEAFLRFNLQHSVSEAQFVSGTRDDLNIDHLSSVFELPRGKRAHLAFSYDLNKSQGKFVDAASHFLKSNAQLQLASHWRSTAGIDVGRITSRGPGSRIEQNRGGLRAGIQYNREWERIRFGAGVSVGFSRDDFENLPDRRATSRGANLDGRLNVGVRNELFWTAATSVDENDVTGVGFTYNEDRGTLGWETRFNSRWRMRTSGLIRRTVNDTFHLGIQENRTVGVENSLQNGVGGFILSLTTSEGISNFLPDPGTSGKFLPGTDLVSESEVVSFTTHWRLSSRINVMAQVRLENRKFASIGSEDVSVYRSEIHYQKYSWNISAMYSHYARSNGLDFMDDTWTFKISKLFK